MKTNELSRILAEPAVTFYDDTHPHPKYGKHVYVDANDELYTGCTTISDAWDKSFFLGPWTAKEMCLEILSYPFEEITADPNIFESLVTKAKSAARRKGDKAKQDGTAAHDWIEAAINAKMTGDSKLMHPYPESPEALNAVNAFIGWAKSINATWLASEEVVCSKEHRTAGKLDAIASIDGIPYLVDFKTSGQLSESYLLQCAGYDIMLREMGFQVAGYMIVRIPKDGKPAETLTITNREDMQFFRETFLKQREAHKFYSFMQTKFKDASGKMKVDAPPEKIATASAATAPSTPAASKKITTTKNHVGNSKATGKSGTRKRTGTRAK